MSSTRLHCHSLKLWHFFQTFQSRSNIEFTGRCLIQPTLVSQQSADLVLIPEMSFCKNFSITHHLPGFTVVSLKAPPCRSLKIPRHANGVGIGRTDAWAVTSCALAILWSNHYFCHLILLVLLLNEVMSLTVISESVLKSMLRAAMLFFERCVSLTIFDGYYFCIFNSWPSRGSILVSAFSSFQIPMYWSGASMMCSLLITQGFQPFFDQAPNRR